MRSVAYILPWGPTGNTLYPTVGRRRILSSKGRQYRKDVAECVGKVAPLMGRLGIHVIAYPPDKRVKRDLDNLWKALLDSLGEAGVYADDSQFYDERIVRGDPRPPFGEVQVIIAELGEAWVPPGGVPGSP